MIKKLILGFFVLLVCACVYLHGTGYRFSVEAYVTNITEGFETPPELVDMLTVVWTEPLPDSEGGGSTDSADQERTSFFEKVTGFLSDIVVFVRRCLTSLILIADYLSTCLKNAKLFYPWNAIVPIGG